MIGSFIPACGDCWFCNNGQSNLCESTYTVMMTPRATRSDGTPLPTMTGLGTFAEVDDLRLDVPREGRDRPPRRRARAHRVRRHHRRRRRTEHRQVVPGSAVAVIGCGGVGQAVVQGAKIAGAGPHHRGRPRGAEAQDGAAARRHRRRRPVRRRPGRAGPRRSPAAAAPTTRSRSSATRPPSARPST